MLFSLAHSIRSELTPIIRSFAYHSYLAQAYPNAIFEPGCIASGKCYFDLGVHVENRTTLINCHVGRYTCIGFDSRYMNCHIGAFSSLGPQVLAGLGMHPTNFVSTSPAFYSPNHSTCLLKLSSQELFVEQSEINIGHDVWVGARAIILDGVKIGDGAIVAAGAVVTKDVLPYSIVGGVPAKIIRMRFDDSIITRLLDIHWWDKDIKWITSHAPYFTDMDSFLAKS